MLEGGQRPTTIESLPLAMARFSGIKSELSGWATAEISFEFNPKGTHLFSIFELAYAGLPPWGDPVGMLVHAWPAGHRWR